MNMVKSFDEFVAVTNDKMPYEHISEMLDIPEIIKPGLDNFCRTLSKILRDVNVDPIIDIFGETCYDQPRTSKSYLRCDTGIFRDDAAWALVDGYLCYDEYGDYVSFVHKPSNTQLDNAKDYIERAIKKKLGASKTLWDKYNASLTVSIKKYNLYYQPKGTYAIGLSIAFSSLLKPRTV